MNDDIDHIMAVMELAFDPAFGEAWTRRQVEGALMTGRTRALLIGEDLAGTYAGGAAAGFALLRATLDEEELLLFAIRPDARRRGLGRALLDRAIASARADGMKRMLLEMRRGNEAETLYRAAGFLPVGLRPEYYRGADGRRLDAITFELLLE